MREQIKNYLVILLAVCFLLALTVGAASAQPPGPYHDHGGHGYYHYNHHYHDNHYNHHYHDNHYNHHYRGGYRSYGR